MTLQIFWPKPGNPREGWQKGGTNGREGGGEGGSRAKPGNQLVYLYNTNSVASVCLSVNYRWPNGWTKHHQIWHAYEDRYWNGSYVKNLALCMVRKGGLIGATLRSG